MVVPALAGAVLCQIDAWHARLPGALGLTARRA
jgi:hypothetical protein